MSKTLLKAAKENRIKLAKKQINTEYQKYSFLLNYQSKGISNNVTMNHPSKLQVKSRITTLGKIKFCNTDFIETSKFNKKELTKSSVNKLIHPEMPKTIFKHVINELNNKNEVVAIIKHLDKDGNTFWLNTHFKPNLSDNFNIAYSTLAIPTSKKTQHKLEKIYKTLHLIEQVKSEEYADKYFNGLLEFEYGNYAGFTLNAFI